MASRRLQLINLPQHELRAGLVVTERITGKVAACSIVDIRFENRGSDQVETELVLELD